ncbi:MAG: flagellar biosynthesis protein FlhF, partial [Pirellulales bacterium]
ASTEVHVPSRLPERLREVPAAPNQPVSGTMPAAHLEHDYRTKFRDDLKAQIDDLQTMVEDLCMRTGKSRQHELPESLFRVFTELIDADVTEESGRELMDRIRRNSPQEDLQDADVVMSRIARSIEGEICVSGPIQTTSGRRTVVALVGPTGVGKTTTIAKLAANFRLREQKRVGLITVDTYRIAAVEQLRTYADIIDLPMEVVSTAREMREATARMADLDLVLLDTAGRSPRDEIKVRELKAMLAEAGADEVHLVLSSVAGSRNLLHTVEKFAHVGTTALILTKLDEATGLGNLMPVLRSGRLPLSYLTNGQNVPDDIIVAERHRLARLSLGMEA